MILKKIFKKTGVLIHILFWGATIYVVLYELYLRRIPERFPGTWRFGIIFKELALAVIASCIFYVLIVILERIHNEARANEYISEKTFEIVSLTRLFLDALRKATNITNSDWPPNPTEVQHISQTITPNSKIKLILSTSSVSRIATWKDYFIIILGGSEACIKKIWLHMPFLDAKFVMLIGKIENCKFFEYIRDLQFAGVPPVNFAKIWEHLYHYFQIVFEIDKHANANFQRYREKYNKRFN